MNRKLLIVLITGIIVILLVFKGTYSLDEDINDDKISLNLMYDKDNLNDNFYNYIDLIDNFVIPTSSYAMSNVLSDNYDFLTVFAIDFILKHESEYTDNIVILNDYNYGGYHTNKYVKKDVIYKITGDVFNKKDYVIINDYLKIYDDMVPLLVVNNYDYDMQIDRIVNILEDNNTYVVSVKYNDIDLIYKYMFLKMDNRLILKNIEI